MDIKGKIVMYLYSHTVTEMKNKNKCFIDLRANRSDSEYIGRVKTQYKKTSAIFHTTTMLREKTDN